MESSKGALTLTLFREVCWLLVSNQQYCRKVFEQVFTMDSMSWICQQSRDFGSGNKVL
jgi:hypothetical protein